MIVHYYVLSSLPSNEPHAAAELHFSAAEAPCWPGSFAIETGKQPGWPRTNVEGYLFFDQEFARGVWYYHSRIGGDSTEPSLACAGCLGTTALV
jgi:hypothetical protein